MPAELPLPVERAFRLARVDFAPAHRQPSMPRLLAAMALSLGGSLFADALLVRFGEQFFPSTWYYPHFQFPDYSKLTVIGVIIACLAWPVVTRISSEPCWLFFRQAIAVTLVLLLPDAYLLYKGQNPQAVGVLVIMHLVIALITYNCLVHLAKVRTAPAGYRHGGGYDAGWDAGDGYDAGQDADDRYHGTDDSFYDRYYRERTQSSRHTRWDG